MLRKDVLARPVTRPRCSVSVESEARLHRGRAGDPFRVLQPGGQRSQVHPRRTARIAIRWWVDDDGGHFSVTDTGIGIPPEHIPRLTERFYRVDAGRSRATGGSGLGLAIVKHVLQRHGATLEVKSAQGVGSTFTCHFPPARVSQPARRGPLGDRLGVACAIFRSQKDLAALSSKRHELPRPLAGRSKSQRQQRRSWHTALPRARCG